MCRNVPDLARLAFSGLISGSVLRKCAIAVMLRGTDIMGLLEVALSELGSAKDHNV
jgi:hypothetical protein